MLDVPARISRQHNAKACVIFYELLRTILQSSSLFSLYARFYCLIPYILRMRLSWKLAVFFVYGMYRLRLVK